MIKKPGENYVIDGIDFCPSLPSVIRSKSGIAFDPNRPAWSYRDGVYSVYMDFSGLHFSAVLMASFHLTLIWFVENRAPSTVMGRFAALKAFALRLQEGRVEPLETICGNDVLIHCDANDFQTRDLFAFLRRWHAMSLPGIQDDVVYVLDRKKLRKRETGIAVLTWDPELGPFTPIEQVGIQDALNEAYGAGRLSEDIYLLAWLFIALGSRPVQLAALKVCDVVRSVAADGTESFLLLVPRAKQQNALLRQELKPRALVNQIGRPLFDYARRVSERFIGAFPDPQQAPLFPLPRQSQYLADGPGWARYHRTSENLRKLLVTALDKLSVRSERTGEIVSICALRFRRTLGTNLAREGHGVLVIADLLDHSRTDSAAVYVAATPELAMRIEKATALYMAPLAQAFKGQLIAHEDNAVRGADRSSRIIDLRIDQSARPMGSCGSFSFCGLFAPVACYTCQCFQPWLDGPHEAVLDFLLADAKRYPDGRIAAINDRTLLAVAEVVQLCRSRKEQAHGR
ncbi:site-specific integrase [Pseudomonas grimontii]|uniref:Site-specific integrase n=1 Tax=Pseudomonas grimontii TaxID=129847 RepID=A0A5C5NG19_9PSED|nr:site-specific integrase [Pseudomonas grimontii]TWR51955.1 site-specific integrase [Pseudomonas grimontii]